MPKGIPSEETLEKRREQDWLNEKIPVEFMNIEDPGLSITFSYGTTKKPEKYTLFHGGHYELPRHVVQHIESRQIPIYNYRADGSGNMAKELIGYKPRFQCRQRFV